MLVSWSATVDFLFLFTKELMRLRPPYRRFGTPMNIYAIVGFEPTNSVTEKQRSIQSAIIQQEREGGDLIIKSFQERSEVYF